MIVWSAVQSLSVFMPPLWSSPFVPLELEGSSNHDLAQYFYSIVFGVVDFSLFKVGRNLGGGITNVTLSSGVKILCMGKEGEV